MAKSNISAEEHPQSRPNAERESDSDPLEQMFSWKLAKGLIAKVRGLAMFWN